MRRLYIAYLLLSTIIGCPAQTTTQKPVINNLEDFFRFENVKQLTSYFGDKNVYSEIAYFGDPNNGGKSQLVSQVNFGTHRSVLVTWNHAGTLLLEVRTSAYYYDFDAKKIRLIPNAWKTRQGVYAGMSLSQLVKVNWFALSFRSHPGSLTDGLILPGFGWLKEKVKVPYSSQRLLYNYTLDLKQLNEFFPQLSGTTLSSTNRLIRKWNPMLELISMYREGLKPEE